MGGYYLNDDEFIAEWNKIGSPLSFARIHGMSERAVYNRRRSLETRLGITLNTFNDTRVSAYKKTEETVGNTRRGMDIEKGRVIVFSDAHFWPGMRSTAFKGLLWAIRKLKPVAVIGNGDIFDGSSASRDRGQLLFGHTLEQRQVAQQILGACSRAARCGFASFGPWLGIALRWIAHPGSRSIPCRFSNDRRNGPRPASVRVCRRSGCAFAGQQSTRPPESARTGG